MVILPLLEEGQKNILNRKLYFEKEHPLEFGRVYIGKKKSLQYKTINMSVKQNIKDQIDSAINAGNQAKANRNGFGLILNIPGARYRVSYNEKGLSLIHI